MPFLLFPSLLAQTKLLAMLFDFQNDQTCEANIHLQVHYTSILGKTCYSLLILISFLPFHRCYHAGVVGNRAERIRRGEKKEREKEGYLRRLRRDWNVGTL